MVKESDLSVQTIFMALQQEIDEDPEVPEYAKVFCSLSDPKLFEEVTNNYEYKPLSSQSWTEITKLSLVLNWSYRCKNHLKLSFCYFIADSIKDLAYCLLI